MSLFNCVVGVRHETAVSFCVVIHIISPQDLIKEIKSEISGNFETLIVSLMESKTLFDAKSLRRAMKVQ